VKLLDMAEIADRRVDGFSLGQRLKVAIARALVHDPPNVLLDEPTAGLDVMTTRAMRQVVVRLRDEGKCVVLSSHVMQEVARLADRVVVVARGRVRVDATPDELRAQTGRENLEDAFVAALGSDEGVLA
jgi:sodium transport system ATP-binding protein